VPPGQSAAVGRGLIALVLFLTFHAAVGFWLLKKGPAEIARTLDRLPGGTGFDVKVTDADAHDLYATRVKPTNRIL